MGVRGEGDDGARTVRPSARSIAAVAVASALTVGGTAWANHGPDSDHLPPVSKNVEIVSKLEPTSQGPIASDQIDDLTVHEGFAYLQSGSNCGSAGRGFYAIDIRDPAAPSEVSFTPAPANTYHGEGAHAVSIDTPAFSGDLLAVSNETCPGPPGAGGFDLYDVSDPANPAPLIQGFGDFGGEGTLTGAESTAHGSQSIFIWDAGQRAYAAVVDNEELHALDIFEITDPESPQPVREYNLGSEAPPETDTPNGNDPFLQDMVVKRVDGRWMLLASYFDGGYVLVDVTDPAAADYVADTDFGISDPLTGFDPPEGNAHYAEFTHDNGHVVTAEQDIQPYRLTQIEVEGKGDFPARAVRGGGVPSDLPDGRLNGPMAYGGYACQDPNPTAGDTPRPVPAAETTFPSGSLQPGEEQILVVQRGPDGDSNEDYDGDGSINDPDDACFPGTKADTAANAGWDAIVIINRHQDGGAAADAASCGGGGYQQFFVTACTTHEAGHAIFDDPATYDRPYDDEIEMAPVGTVSSYKLDARSAFDGWGYMGLYSMTPDPNGKLPLADAYAIPEAMNPDYATGFGELSIREQAADPTEPLSYASYRSAGLRVFSFESGKITPQGAFVDVGGNDLWGVEQFTSGNGERLIAASDRDYGLYVFRYTGPLAPVRPACSGSDATVPAGGSVTVPLVCTDANGNPLNRQIVSGPTAGTLGPVNQANGTVTYTNTDQSAAADSFRFAADDGAATSAPATVTLAIESSPPPPDTTAPETSIDRRPKDELEGSKAKYGFSSSEPDSSFECRLDRGEYKPCTSPKKLKRLKPGKHKFTVRAIDAAGNADPRPAKDKFRVL